MRIPMGLGLVVTLASVAAADAPEPVRAAVAAPAISEAESRAKRKAPRPAGAGISIAAGVNLPFRWRSERQSIAGSLQVGFRRHHAIRATLAMNPYMHNIGASVIEVIAAPDSEGSSMTGQVTEIGIGWQYFPRALNRGPSLEAGVFRRHVDGEEDYRFSGPEYIATHTVGYGVRGLVGWSWRFWGDHVFFATAFGLGMARHVGTETSATTSLDDERRVESITRYQASPEFYVRVGGVIDL